MTGIFLDRVSTRIVEVDRGAVFSYPGSYSEYVRLKEERLDMAKASERKRQSILRTGAAVAGQGSQSPFHQAEGPYPAD